MGEAVTNFKITLFVSPSLGQCHPARRQAAGWSRTAAEYQAKRLHVSGGDRRQCPDDMPILLHEDGTWQIEIPLHFEQILERRLIEQSPTPASRRGDGVKIFLSREQPD